jgi:bifunctional NMN adenylyltransferase/nudix hydrolase
MRLQTPHREVIMKYDFCVFIGRFSIFHNAHLAIIQQALERAKEVIIVIGSANTAPSVRNPWTAAERGEMIGSSFDPQINKRLKFIFMRDYLYNDNMWVSVLQEKINSMTSQVEGAKVALTGFESDETSFYLKLFPQFEFISFDKEFGFHASELRDKYFSHDVSYKPMIPNGTLQFLEKFKDTSFFKTLKDEKDYIDRYKESWRGAPFVPIFCTVDCLVLKSGHILVVKRGRNPGKGLYAMPGGFVHPSEKLQEAALRELKEETGIKINIPELRKAITDHKVFDDPMRSARGRVISHTYLIDLGAGTLPLVKGGDDAALAHWLPLSEYYLLEDQFFEDHFHIIGRLVSKY